MKINKFTGMGKDGLYYTEGLSPENMSGKSTLSPSWTAINYISEDTDGFAGMGVYKGMDKVEFDSTNSNLNQILGIDGGDIFGSNTFLGTDLGKLHTIPPTGSGTDQIFASQNPDIKVSLNNNIVYSSSNHLGVGFVGTVATGSGTEKIIDTDGRDFTTLGVTTNTGSNKVYNLTDGEEHTITSITTTNSTNDTLNFTAGTASAESEKFMVFVDDRFKFDVSLTTGIQFGNQGQPHTWVRQIEIWDAYMWILNGNYLSRLAIDDTTWTSDLLVEEHKQLPYLTQATCMKSNQDMLLIGGDYKGKGRLVLTDGWSDGWLSIIKLTKKPSSIVAYGSGWVVLVDKTLYYTNGYTLDEITTFQEDRPDDSRWTVSYNGMINFSDKIIINVFNPNSAALTASKDGIFIYDLKNRWSYCPFVNSTDSTKILLKTLANGAIYFDGDYLYASARGDGDNTNFVNQIKAIGTTTESSTIFYVDLPERQKISGIKLKLSPSIKYTHSEGNVKVTVNIGDGKRPMWKYTQTKVGSTASSIINSLATSGARYHGRVGAEIRCLDGTTTGERSYITAIANIGEATETWTISPALSATPTTGTAINIMGLEKTETHTFDGTNIPDDIPFYVDGFFSDKLFVEVVINPISEQTIDIYEIEIME